MEQLNSFTGGMNKDLSKSLFKEGTYNHAENFSLVTDVGLSTGSLRNIKGNEFFINIPDCSEIVQITTLEGVTVGNYKTGIIFINNEAVAYQVSTLKDLGQLLYDNPDLAAANIGISYSDTRILIYGLLVNNVLATTSINVNYAGNTLTPYIQAVTAPKIIGWNTVRDQIIIFTANNSEEEPVQQLGQIWKVVYDKVNNFPTVTLLYNDYLNFSLAHPIANPGATVGNFETPEVQKIYWTDNYNRPRLLNVADPQSMALEVDLLDIAPNISKAVATVSKIIGGGLIKTGVYQISGRLTKLSGAKSAFIIPSNPIPVVNPAEGNFTPFSDYEARDAGYDANKSIVGKLYNLDTDYDKIEPVILYRETLLSVPTVYLLPSESIPNNGEYEFIYSGGSQVVIPISGEEFLESKIIFDTVKTMASKNNMLFFGNVKYADFDVEFDARAYRFTNTNSAGTSSVTATLKNSAGAQQYVINGSDPTNSAGNATYTNWTTIPYNADAVQTNADQAPDGKKYHLWQRDGVTFGGEGPNVKYEFVSMYSFRDTNKAYKVPLDVNGVPTSVTNSGVLAAKAPYATADVVTTTIDLDSNSTTEYNQVNQFESYFNPSSPYVTYGLRGYQRDETYRFGIVFYSKKGQSSYVYWVGDIRMPKVYMPSTSGAAATENRDSLAFPLCTMYDGTTNAQGNDPTSPTLGPSREFYGNPLGIKFTVDVSSVIDQISGYSIVRVARTDTDKTVLGQGVFSPVWYEGDGGDYSSYTVPGGYTSSWQDTSSTGSNSGFKKQNFGICSPEFLFKEHPSFNPGDQIDFIQVSQSLHDYNYIYTWDGSPANTSFNGGYVRKNYTAYASGIAPKAADVTNNKYTPVTFHESKVLKPSEVFDFYLSRNSTTTANPINNFSPPRKSFGGTTSGIIDGNGSYYPRGLGGTRLVMGIQTVTSPQRDLNSLNPSFPSAGATFDQLASNDYVKARTSGISANENIYIVNYRRPTTIQYGGSSYSSRSYSEYISTGHVQLIDGSTSVHTSMVFGGDTYVTLFDYSNILRNPNVFGKIYDYSGPSSSSTGPASYENTALLINLAAVECTFPVELRKQSSKPSTAVDDGYAAVPRCAPNKSTIYQYWPNSITGGSGPYTTLEWSENFEVDFNYFIDNNIVKFFPYPEPFVLQTKFDVRVHRSQEKTNGELSESWGIFKTEEYIDVDTAQGELNNLIIYQNSLVGFQDKGIVALSVKDRAISPDISGSEIILGTGGVLENYKYVSKIIGSRHQFSFATSHDAIFWFDINTKNMYKLQGEAPVAITVAKGMSSYLSNNLGGIIQDSDNPFLFKGITATYDFRYNEAIMTFRDTITDKSKSLSTFITSIVGDTYYINLNTSPTWFSPGSTVILDEMYYGTVIAGGGIVITDPNPFLVGSKTVIYPSTRKQFTLAYNDIIDAYTSFYSFTPSVYINDQKYIFSPASDLNSIYRHDSSLHGSFYGSTPQKSVLKMIINPAPTETKVFDNYEMVTESIDLSTGINIPDDIFNRIRLYNDYQNTNFQSLPIDNGKQVAKRKERTWNISNLRNRVQYINNPADIFNATELGSGDKLFGERLRDKYLFVDLEYDNLNDYRLILHAFKTIYRKSAR